jgi:hypothetical protein
MPGGFKTFRLKNIALIWQETTLSEINRKEKWFFDKKKNFSSFSTYVTMTEKTYNRYEVSVCPIWLSIESGDLEYLKM